MSTTGKEVSLSWPDDAESLVKPVKSTSDREQVPLIMAGRSDGKRGDAAVISRSMFCIDVDCKPKEDESEHGWKVRSGIVRVDMLKALRFLAGPDGFDHAWHTTHSHDDDKRLGWRVWIPLTEDVPAMMLARWRDAMHAINIRVFNRIADTTTYNPERLMRLPATHPERLDVYDCGLRADGKLLAFETAMLWWKSMPTAEQQRQRGARVIDTPKIYKPANGDFPLPGELVSDLRLQCAQIAQSNQRLKIETRNALSALARCESLKRGERDNGLTGLVGIFSNRFLEHEPRPLLESLLLPVLKKTQADAPDDPIKPGHDAHSLCNWTIAQVEGRRADAQNPLGHLNVSPEEADQIRYWTDGARSGGMAESEFNAIAKTQGVSPETFKKHLFITSGASTWVWQVKGYSVTPYHRVELTTLVAKAALAGVGVSRRIFNEETNEFKSLTLSDILQRHSSKAHNFRASYLVDAHHFDYKTSSFVEALAPRRKLEPKEHPAIQEWLHVVGREPLIDWVASVPRVENSTAILLLVGKKNIGKTLLAQGLAQLWETGAPAKARDVLASNFNDDLARTPFVFADEELPPGTSYRESIGAQLREIVSAPNLTLRRKFMPNAAVEGHVRVMVASNSDNPLLGFASDGYRPTPADLAGIAERVLLINADPAEDILARHSKEEISSWRTEFKIAEHALWLRDNWKIKNPGGRFLVSGNSEQALAKLVVGDEFTSQMLDWFVSYALHHTKAKTSSVRQGFFSSGGELYVALSVIIASWSDFRPAYRMGSSEPFITTLKTISHPEHAFVKRGEDTREYWRVNLDYVELYAKRLGMGPAAVKRAIMERDDPSAEFFGGEGGAVLTSGAKVLTLERKRASVGEEM